MEVTDFKHINLDYLDLMCDKDLDMRKQMIDMLLQELPDEVNKLMPLFKARNWDELHAVSHKLKSTLAFVGNETIISINKNLEANTKSQKEENSAHDAINKIVELVPDILQDLRKAQQQKNM